MFPILLVLLLMLPASAIAEDLDAQSGRDPHTANTNQVVSVLLQPYSVAPWFTTTTATTTATTVALPAGGIGTVFSVINLGAVPAQVGVNGTTPTTEGGTGQLYVPAAAVGHFTHNTPVTSIKVHCTSTTAALVITK